MIRRTFGYEARLAKDRWWVFAIILFVLLLSLILLSTAPLRGEDPLPALRNADGSFAYPSGLNHDLVLGQYRAQRESLLQQIAAGEIPAEENRDRLDLLNFFIDNDTTEYECLLYQCLFQARLGARSLACGLSLLEGAAFLMPLLSSGLGAYLFGSAARKRRLRPMVEGGCDRGSLFWGKTLFGCALLCGFWLVVSVLGLAILAPYLKESVLIDYWEGYRYVPLFSMVLARILGLAVSGLFYFAFSSLLGLLFRHEGVSFTAPILLFVFFFLLSNSSSPSFGYYGQLKGMGGWLILCLPFSDIVIGGDYGFLKETPILFAAYLVLTGLFCFFTDKRMRRMAL